MLGQLTSVGTKPQDGSQSQRDTDLYPAKYPCDSVCYLENAMLRFGSVFWPRLGLEPLTSQVRTWLTGPAAALLKKSHFPMKVF